MNGFFFLSAIKKGEEDGFIEDANKAMRAWTDRAARAECGWTCSDCCASFSEGMPDECAYGHQGCTDIIRRDKINAGAKVKP